MRSPELPLWSWAEDKFTCDLQLNLSALHPPVRSEAGVGASVLGLDVADHQGAVGLVGVPATHAGALPALATHSNPPGHSGQPRLMPRKPPPCSALPGSEKNKTLLTTDGSQAGAIASAERRSGTERKTEMENRELLSVALSHKEANCPSRGELESQQSTANRKA